MQSKRVFVTGAQGFVGKRLCEKLKLSGHHQIQEHQGDLLDRQALKAQVLGFKPEVVIHLAAISLPKDCSENPEKAQAVNVIATEELGKICLELNHPVQFVFASTAHVYSKTALSMGLPVTELAEIGPQNLYAETKYSAEKALKNLSQEKFKILVLRIFNHVHKSQPQGTFLSSVYHQVLKNQNPLIVGNLDLERDLSPISQLIQFLERTIDYKAISNFEVINVASGQARNLQKLATELLAQMGKEFSFQADPALIRPDEPRIMIADCSKMRKILNMDLPTINDRQLIQEFLSDAV